MIHWPRVRQLRDEVGADEFGEVVEIFLEEVEETIEKLRADTARSDLGRNLHFLKGSALSLGFQTFSRLCQDGERLSAAGTPQEVDVEGILASYADSKTVFQTELAQNI